MADPRRIGPFLLHTPLARGASGQVWRARHAASGRPVAVKLLRPEGRAFQRASMEVEVAAMAALDHPHILWLYDQGRTEGAIDDLPAGTPWFAMELATGGTLGQRADRIDGAGVMELLEQVLGALAHAHARGLLHRDLKPANILWAEGALPGWKLGDFGLALGRHTPRDHRGATVSYAAPEQLLALPSQGPWTDLYALAATVWHVVTGSPPFVGSPDEVVEAHITSPPPAFRPLFEVPEGLEEWLRWMLAKGPGERPTHAADAQAMLRAFTAGGDDDDEPTVELSHPHDASRPPLRSWRGPRSARGHSLQGAGLGLFALRSHGMAGREDERDTIWELLEEAHQGRRGAVALVRGLRGMGSSHLCRWVGLRAAELGLARFVPLQLDGGPRQLAHELISPLFTGAHTGDLTAFAEAAGMGDDEVEALQEALRSVRGDGVVSGLLRLLRAATRERPVVLFVDDVPEHPWAMRLARAVVRAEGLRVLLLLTADSLALHEDGGLDAAWTALAEHARGRELVLEALAAEDLDVALDGLLPAAPDLRAALRAASGGAPGHLVQLLADGLERGIVVPSDQGYRVAAGRSLVPSEALPPLARRRLDTLWASLSEGERAGVHALASLGDVSLPVWQQLRPDGLDLVVRLLRLGHVSLEGRQLRFADPSFRAAAASRRPVDPALHRRAAELLADEGVDDEVVGRHLLAAGVPDDALPRLLRGAASVTGRGDAARALTVLGLVDEALSQSSRPDDHPDRVDALRLRSAALSRTGQVGHAVSVARRAVQLADRCGDATLPVSCRRALAAALLMSGDLSAGERVLDEALVELRQRGLGTTRLSGSMHVQLAELRLAARRYREAMAAADVALSLRASDVVSRCWAWHHRACAAQQLQQPEEAERSVLEGQQLARDEGLLLAQGNLLTVAGLLAKDRREWLLAEARFTEAVDVLRVLGTPDAAVPRANLALLACQLGDHEAGLGHGLQARRALRGAAWKGKLAYVDTLLLWPLAALHRFDAFDQHLAGARRVLEFQTYDHDLVDVLDLVRDALPADQGVRRASVERFAEAVRKALGAA
jgi:serine/threonine protein kinase/tetratricopeptide (TPR) repeat protein